MDADVTIPDRATVDGCRVVRVAGDEAWLDCVRFGCSASRGPFWSDAQIRHAARQHAVEHTEAPSNEEKT